MGLRSNLFRGDAGPEAATNSDPTHVTPGASGPHVSKIQAALMMLRPGERPPHPGPTRLTRSNGH
jgi:hypothetical protein